MERKKRGRRKRIANGTGGEAPATAATSGRGRLGSDGGRATGDGAQAEERRAQSDERTLMIIVIEGEGVRLVGTGGHEVGGRG